MTGTAGGSLCLDAAVAIEAVGQVSGGTREQAFLAPPDIPDRQFHWASPMGMCCRSAAADRIRTPTHREAALDIAFLAARVSASGPMYWTCLPRS